MTRFISLYTFECTLNINVPKHTCETVSYIIISDERKIIKAYTQNYLIILTKLGGLYTRSNTEYKFDVFETKNLSKSRLERPKGQEFAFSSHAIGLPENNSLLYIDRVEDYVSRLVEL